MPEFWMSHMQYICISTLHKLLRSDQDRRILNAVNYLRWCILQKECLNAGAQPDIFQGRGGFMELVHFDKHFA